ncbi:DUF6551 family protein [Gordonia phosphorivorans]|uniref:DUF6551 family protein n=1 Tax=Gordonia phosphorivorans TaxID=1056982 RepID=A0ABV6H6K1_9ACTN
MTTDTYVTAVHVNEMFADPTYQRELNESRAVSMSKRWQPHLVGVLDVSDRGETECPRYAIINGQHRWAAACHVDADMALPVTVHSGLTVDDEARLFWDIDRETKKLSTWDRWYARRAAGDPIVRQIDAVAHRFGYVVSHNPRPPADSQLTETLQCCAALEWSVERCDTRTLHLVLELIGDIWPGDPEARKSAVIRGLSLVLHDYADELDTGRLADALSSITPAQLQARAHELKSRGHKGGIPHLVARAALMAYNRLGNPKIRL